MRATVQTRWMDELHPLSTATLHKEKLISNDFHFTSRSTIGWTVTDSVR